MCGQTTGAALAAGVLTAVWGRERSILCVFDLPSKPLPPEDTNDSSPPSNSLKGGGCCFDRATLSQGQAVLNEAAICFGVVFLAFGVGLDPRTALLFGPRYGPMLVGVSIGVIAFATSGAVPGYAGAAMNPARCFASGIVRRDMSGELSSSRVVQRCGADEEVSRPVDLVGWAGGGGTAVCGFVQYSATSVDDDEGGGCREEGRGEPGLMLEIRMPVWSCGDGDRMESREWRHHPQPVVGSVSGENSKKTNISRASGMG